MTKTREAAWTMRKLRRGNVDNHAQSARVTLKARKEREANERLTGRLFRRARMLQPEPPPPCPYLLLALLLLLLLLLLLALLLNRGTAV